MNKYQLLALNDVLMLISFFGIIVCSALFSWWLMFLLLILGNSESERRILDSSLQGVGTMNVLNVEDK